MLVLSWGPHSMPDAVQAEMMIVQVCEFLDVGDGVYRFHTPSRALSRLPGDP